MPTTASMTFSGKKLEPYMAPQDARYINVALPANTAFLARGTVLGELTATPGTYKAYASGNADGSQVAKAILPFDVATDAAGLITLTPTSGTSTGGELGLKMLTVPVYIQGIFKTSELTGLDAAGLANLSGALISGTVADGIARIG